MVMEHPGP